MNNANPDFDLIEEKEFLADLRAQKMEALAIAAASEKLAASIASMETAFTIFSGIQEPANDSSEQLDHEVSEELYLAEGIERFGTNPDAWPYICPDCQTVQSANDFVKVGLHKNTASQMVGMFCVGLVDKGKGCTFPLNSDTDYPRSIISEGETHSVFNFAIESEQA